MKKSKIIIPALGMLVLSTAATVTGTVAWFTMNATAKAEGMYMAAKTSGSLIVKENVYGQTYIDENDQPATKVATLPGSGDKATKVVFDSTAHSFYPSTHDLAVGTVTGLRRVTNGMEVNFETGTQKGNTKLTYGPVADADKADYFFDYGLFVAADGMAMDGYKLHITISAISSIAANMNNAFSVDFYGALVNTAIYPSVNTTNYLGTLNLANRKNVLEEDQDDGFMRPTGAVTTTAGQSVTYVETPTINIPKADTEHPAAYSLMMRVYFDGELIDVSKTGFKANYSPAEQTNVSGSESFYYYTDQIGTIVDAKPGDNPSTSNWYTVNQGTSTKTYARSIDAATFNNQGIDVSITASKVNS